MAYTHVDTNSATTTTGAVTPTLPTGWAANDLLVLTLYSDGGTIVAPGTWTLVRRSTFNGANQHVTYWKIAGAGETAPACTGGSSRTNAVISGFRGGPASGFVLDVENGQVNAAQTATTSPGVTTSQANDLMNHSVAIKNTGGHTAPSSPAYTEPAQGDTTVGSTTAVSYLIGQAAGATGNISGTASAAVINVANLMAFFETIPVAGKAPPPWEIFRNQRNALVRM